MDLNSLRVGDDDNGSDKVEAIGDWQSSTAFSASERVALELADRMTATPPAVDDAFWERLRAHFDEPQAVRLAAAIALENFRSRLNPALGVDSQGFCMRPAGSTGTGPDDHGRG